MRRDTPRKKSQPGNSPTTSKPSNGWWNEILSVICFVLAVFLLLSVVSGRLAQPDFAPAGLDAPAPAANNLMGVMGQHASVLAFGFFGWASLVLVAWLAWFSFWFWNYTAPRKNLSDAGIPVFLLGFSGMLVFSAALISITSGEQYGGLCGKIVSAPLISNFSPLGAGLLLSVFLLLSTAMATRTTLAHTLSVTLSGLIKTLNFSLLVVPGVLLRLCIYGTEIVFELLMKGLGVSGGSDEDEEDDLPAPRRRKSSSGFVLSDAQKRNRPAIEDRIEKINTSDVPEGLPEEEEKSYKVIVSRKGLKPASRNKKAEKPRDKKAEYSSDYKFPPLSLLSPAEPLADSEDDEELARKSLLIESKLRDFGINGRVTHVHPGPVITTFEFEPAPGVKVGRIAALDRDLAMGLKASSIRILAPMPRRGTVGIEVPNRHREIVRLRDLLESENLTKTESTLNVPIGKDTSGDPVIADISLMPHLLIAGTTGTGKSVFVNSIILSLLYRATPEELGLILIDPKILELSVYEGIPHLRVPVVVHPKQAKAVLLWAIEEMNRRYRLMQKFNVRSIDGFNRVVSGKGGDVPIQRVPEETITLGEDQILEEGEVPVDDGEGIEELEARPVERLKPLPKIVIIVDELADLMFSSGREIEELITRLAQKARASGIHLILATQRPSVDVITGLIKANFPARVSFRVATKIDSRTILDTGGAEALLGRGDMLFMQPGAEWLRRIHGAFASDNEVQNIVEAVKANGKPIYDEKILDLCSRALEEEESERKAASGSEEDSDGYDELYDKAVEIVVEKGRASTSMIQRVFSIGYNRAAKIIEMMEKEGVIGPMDGAKPREVLITQVGQQEI